MSKTNVLQAAKEQGIVNIQKEKGKIKQWKHKLKARSSLYFRYHRNKSLNEIYSIEITKENPKIPRKFFSHMHKHDTNEEKLIKKQFTIEKVKTEIQLQSLRSDRQFRSLKKIDEEMCGYITNNFAQQTAQSLKKHWTTECRYQEEKAKQKFLDKQKWLKATWMEYIEKNPKSKENKTRKELIDVHPTNNLTKQHKHVSEGTQKNQTPAKSFRNTFEDSIKEKQKQLTKKDQNNQDVSNPNSFQYLSNLDKDDGTKKEQHIYANRTYSIKLLNLTLSKHLFLFLQPYYTPENFEINWLEKYKESKSLIAQSELLFYLQETNRESLKSSNLIFNRGPCERKKLDVIIADTAHEKNLTSLKQSYDNVKLNKKDGNHLKCSI